MLALKKIAVTGGLAAGKTTVCQLFKECGAYVVSADEIVHHLLSPGSALSQQVIQLLGPEIVESGVISRSAVAQKVFADPHLLCALEKILHPAVFKEIEDKYQQINKEKNYPLFLAEIPLLYEAEADKQFDIIIAVTAPKELCEQRFIHEKKQSRDEFKKRMREQLDPKEKAARADFTIENSGSLEELKKLVNQLFATLRRNYARHQRS